MLLDAPDVSFTEAAVGAGISTVLMLSTLRGCKQEIACKFKPLPLITVTLTGLALVYGTLDMPLFGDPNAPIHLYPTPVMLRNRCTTCMACRMWSPLSWPVTGLRYFR